MRSSEHRLQGLSYLEVLIATALISLALVPALESLQTGIRSAAVHEELAVQHHHVASLLETVATEPFPKLLAEQIAAAGAATDYSDAAGSPDRRLVFLDLWDGDDADGDGQGWTGGDLDLIRVRVELENTALLLETLVTP